MDPSETDIVRIRRLMDESESEKQNSETKRIAEPLNGRRRKIVLGKSRDRALLDESFSDAEIDAAIYFVTDRSKFTGEKRANLITALRRTLIGEITFTEAVSNYHICVTTFSPYLMKAREALRKIATRGNDMCADLDDNCLFCDDDRRHKRYHVFQMPEKWKGSHAVLKNAILTTAKEYGRTVGQQKSSLRMSMALMDVLSGDSSPYHAATNHQVPLVTLQRNFENIQQKMNAWVEDNHSTLPRKCSTASIGLSTPAHSHKDMRLEERQDLSSSKQLSKFKEELQQVGSSEVSGVLDLSKANYQQIESVRPLVGSRKRKPMIVRHIVAEEELSLGNSSGEELSESTNETNGFGISSAYNSVKEDDLEKRANAYFLSRIGFKNLFFGVTDEEELLKIKKVVESVCQRSRMSEDMKKNLKEAVEMVIRTRVTVTAAAARTSISTGTIRPYVHEALQLLEQVNVSPSPEELLQKHSSFFDGTSCENSAVTETFDIGDVKRVLNEMLEVSALDEDGRRKIYETVIKVFKEGVSASEACKMHNMAQTTICKYVRKCKARLALAKCCERNST